jgi:hypothetical protein
MEEWSFVVAWTVIHNTNMLYVAVNFTTIYATCMEIMNIS